MHEITDLKQMARATKAATISIAQASTKQKNNAIFISATEKLNVEELRLTILDKVKELYGIRYPYKTLFYE